MSFIGKFFAGTFIFLGTAMLFIMLFRLNNNNGAYIGLSDIYAFFKSNDTDIFGSFSDMVDNVNDTLNDFKKSFIDFSSFTSVWDDGFDWYEIFVLIWEGFKYLFNISLNLTKMIFLPLTTVYYIFQYIVGIIVYFFSFLTFLVTF